MQIEAVKVRRLYLQVAEQLSGFIDAGDIKPGERLPSERDLAAQFGVSRPTVREAMIALEIAGLVEIRSGSGVYVLQSPATAWPEGPREEVPGPLEILEARRVIEGETAALAACRIDSDTLTALRRELAVISDARASTERKEAADQRFHQLIAEASGNSALHSTIVWLWDLRNRTEISHTFHERLRREGSTPVIRDHSAILDALEKGDAEAAREQMHLHLQRVLDLILKD
jgi:GntR family transcriptional repressor for pyruvate dehydrogenase complex